MRPADAGASCRKQKLPKGPADAGASCRKQKLPKGPRYMQVALSTKKIPSCLRHLTWYKSQHGLFAVKAETEEDIALIWTCKEVLIDFSSFCPGPYGEEEEILLK